MKSGLSGGWNTTLMLSLGVLAWVPKQMPKTVANADWLRGEAQSAPRGQCVRLGDQFEKSLPAANAGPMSVTLAIDQHTPMKCRF
ncbi:hypothetical protein QTI17_33960 [Variovorax sp. J31P179]|uniref:hypothetical protein n=1 Tax=Variovorax sp. J31P179 TaxID=3053508 RepID=UPI0025768B0C|nr:hypothetical protein [Variovorax sp. J31P179]MDM0085602.1 hypothetical protein [Variovorax sp. J31P179]